jgi:hypothetical protein
MRHELTAFVVLTIAVAVAACGPASTSASPGTSATASPSPSGSPSDVGPGPSRWPGSAWRAMLALGVADNEIGKATADLQRSIDEEDIGLMREAAAGLAGLDVLLGRVEDIEDFGHTAPFAARYRAALEKLIATSTELRDAIDATDAARIQEANIQLAAALKDYVALRPELSTLVAQAFEQQRLLLN